VALLVAVFDHTHSALAVAALLFAGQALPAFVVPAVVARVEASSRGGELSGLYFMEALITAALAVLLWNFWLPAVLFLVALDGVAALAASALLRAEVARAARDHVRSLPESSQLGERETEEAVQEAERGANAALNIAFSATFVTGPVLGGVIVAAAGASTALFVDVGSFLICGALLLDLRPHVEQAGADSLRARLRAAWRHINETPHLRTLLLVDAVALVLFESAAPIEVSYAKVTLDAGDRGLGLLLTAWGAGAVIGSIVFARLGRRPLAVMLSAGALAIGLTCIGFAIISSLALACVAALVGGMGNGVELPSLISIVQQQTPPNLHGRLMGAVESLGALCVAIGLPLGGALVALSSPPTAFAIVGAGTVVVAGALYVVARGGEGEPGGGGRAVADTTAVVPADLAAPRLVAPAAGEHEPR
jgi:MFS family permease